MSRKGWQHAWPHLQRQFPELVAGVWNCRKISGSSSWSQHSWGGAGDLTHRDWGYSTNPAHQAYLDEVAAWLQLHRTELSIWSYLWRVASHYDHIHVDFEPRGASTPPCAGGLLKSKYKDGSVVNGDPGPVNGIWLPEEDTEMMDLETWARTLRNPIDFDQMAEKGIITQDERDYWVTIDPANPEMQDLRNAVDVREGFWS